MIQFIYETNPVPIFKELIVILEKHKDELCVFPNTKLNPDWKTYEAMHSKGNLAVITARRNDRIIGYTVNIIARHFHYSFIYGVNDIIYIEDEY
ncbi:MAG: hypothetical protein R3250_16485, partial [Melioribacteraceae bacterium]|nr:hypothetical protein [Melioribacteraceae bacterium]